MSSSEPLYTPPRLPPSPPQSGQPTLSLHRPPTVCVWLSSLWSHTWTNSKSYWPSECNHLHCHLIPAHQDMWPKGHIAGGTSFLVHGEWLSAQHRSGLTTPLRCLLWAPCKLVWNPHLRSQSFLTGYHFHLNSWAHCYCHTTFLSTLGTFPPRVHCALLLSGLNLLRVSILCSSHVSSRKSQSGGYAGNLGTLTFSLCASQHYATWSVWCGLLSLFDIERQSQENISDS